jgi:hypothetical protein
MLLPRRMKLSFLTAILALQFGQIQSALSDIHLESTNLLLKLLSQEEMEFDSLAKHSENSLKNEVNIKIFKFVYYKKNNYVPIVAVGDGEGRERDKKYAGRTRDTGFGTNGGRTLVQRSHVSAKGGATRWS